MTETDKKLPNQLLILISLLQGIALLFLHQAMELKFWPHQEPHWLFAMYCAAFVCPIMLLLGLENHNNRKLLKGVSAFTAIATLFGFYVGSQAIPLEHIKVQGLLFAFIVTIAIATFKALMYCQQYASGEPFQYHNLFMWSWRNFLTLGLSLLFAGGVWAVLMLWAALFKAIGIDLFYDVFFEPWFFYLAIALANGFGIIIFRRLTHIIDTITRLQQALVKFLLVILVLVAQLFLLGLVATGLDPLWESGGSTLILWMQALILFFINSVYQDDPDSSPYPIWLHRFIYAGIIILPLYSAISFYGLTLRIDQYGWTISRCWAALIWLCLTLFSLGYVIGIIRQRDRWLHSLSKVNVSMGLVVLALMLLVNTPMLDFRKISVNSQLSRLEDNQVTLEKFDYRYFRFSLARPGYLALKNIKEEHGDTHPEIVLKIDSLYGYGRDKKDKTVSKEHFIAAIQVISGNPPETLMDTLYEQGKSYGIWQTQNDFDFYLFAIDANGDKQMEYVFIRDYQFSDHMELYSFENEKWTKHPILWNSASFPKGFKEAVKKQAIYAETPKWKTINIDGNKFKIGE